MKKLTWLLFPVITLLLLTACQTPPTECTTHTYGEWTTETAATCATAGVEKRTCSVCAYTDSRPIEKLAHTYGEWTTETAATCTAEGLEKQVCSVCADAVTRPLAKLDHTYGAWSVATPATCTAEGVEKRTCSVCTTPDTRPIAKLTHNFGEWTTEREPTCIAEGLEKKLCRLCGAAETRPLAKVAHQLGEWKVETAATCIAEGLEKRTCLQAGCNENETRPIEMLTPHLWGEWSTVTAATCTETGTKKRTCTTQGCTAFEEDTIDMIPHEYDWVIDTEATAYETGIKHEKCTKCPAVRNEGTVIPALDHVHQMTHHPAVSIPCTDNEHDTGTVEYYHCESCDKNYSTAAGNDADELSDITTPKQHSLTPVSAKAATCIAEGNIAYFHCQACEKDYSDASASGAPLLSTDIVIAMRAHEYKDTHELDKQASKTEHGEMWRHCKQDGCTAKTDVIYIHDTDAVGPKDSTCIEEGNIAHFYCPVCGGCYEDEEATLPLDSEDVKVAMKDHNYDTAYTTDSSASTTAHGSESRHCTQVGCTAKVDERIIHNLEYVPEQTATCSATGILAHYHCTCDGCGKNFADDDATAPIENIVAAKKNHIYKSDFEIDKEASETETGEKSRHCIYFDECGGKTEITTIPKLDPEETPEWTPGIK